MERELEPRHTPHESERQLAQPRWAEDQASFLTTLGNHADRYLAAAYAGYLARGRGIILVHLPTSMTGAGAAPVTGVYLTESLILDRWRGWPTEDLAVLLHSYDPEMEMICVLEQRDAALQVYRISPSPGDTTPAAAYTAQQSATPPLRSRPR